jgi:hypothetical protein
LENDSLPHKVCIQCLSSIRASYYFKIQVDESLNMLLQSEKQQQQRLHQYCVPSIKQEPGASVPLIMAPRTVDVEMFEDTEKEDNMLDEMN